MEVTFKIGQQVRFRLGERMPEKMPCCGRMLDTWELLKDFSGREFTIQKLGPFRWCPHCKSPTIANEPEKYGLSEYFNIAGVEYTHFGAYPEELELVG